MPCGSTILSVGKYRWLLVPAYQNLETRTKNSSWIGSYILAIDLNKSYRNCFSQSIKILLEKRIRRKDKQIDSSLTVMLRTWGYRWVEEH